MGCLLVFAMSQPALLFLHDLAFSVETFDSDILRAFRPVDSMASPSYFLEEFMCHGLYYKEFSRIPPYDFQEMGGLSPATWDRVE